MKQKVAASFAIVLAIAMILSTNPAVIMPSSIFASTEEEDSSTDDSDSSESEEQEESESEVSEEDTETEPETETETETEPELVECPDGSQAASSAECPTATTAGELIDCPDGSQAATLAECPTAAATLAAPTVAPTTPTTTPTKEEIKCPEGSSPAKGYDFCAYPPKGLEQYATSVCPLGYTAAGGEGPNLKCDPPAKPATQTTPTTPTTQTGQNTPNSNTGGSSSTFSTTIVNPAAPPTTTNVNPEISNCRLDGNANGIQQQFDTAKFSACGLYPNGQIAYSDGFIAGCTQAGNTQQICVAFIQLNTGAKATIQTQPQTTTQPTQ